MNKKILIVTIAIIALGCFVRLYKLADYPVGLHQDEASIGYEAYALTNYGVDRNGNTWPVHFVAWGSGQNALYAYLAIPFIKLLGNTELAVRLPMALVGCLTLVVAAVLLRELRLRTSGKLLILLLLAIIPWHIMKSRWGLESNLFPDLVFYALVLAYFGITKKKRWCGVLSAVVLGILTYAYGTSYAFVPVALAAAAILLTIRKKVRWQVILWYIAIVAAVALPMILFVFVNYFELENIQFLGFTVPRLDYNRFTSITSLNDANGNFFINCLKNLKESFRILWYQEDGMPRNFVRGYGLFYLFSLPFIFYGFILSWTKKYRNHVMLQLTLAILSGAIVVAMMVEPTIYRINILWLPLFIYLCFGVVDLVARKRLFYWCLVVVYALSFVGFIHAYFTTHQETIRPINRVGLHEAIDYAESTDYEKLYFSRNIGMPYIYYLYYAEIDPHFYYQTREVEERETMFQEVTNIGEKVIFSVPERLSTSEIEVLKNSETPAKNDCPQLYFGEYLVVDCTKE